MFKTLQRKHRFDSSRSSPTSVDFQRLLVVDEECEGGRNPLGIECRNPRLTWRVQSLTEKSRSQSAFRILVASSPALLAVDIGDLWDSGKVDCPASGGTSGIYYGGEPLKSRKRYYWAVQAWDEEGVPELFSEAQWWEMGLLDDSDWLAEWIGYPLGNFARILYFRRNIAVKESPLRARAYVAGIGFHEFHVNGQKAGDCVLEPGWTDYSSRILYIVYDITEFLHDGENTVSAIVAPGWLGMPVLMAQIELGYADGSTEIVCTRGGHSDYPRLWQVRRGPILDASIYDGEKYDARLETVGWDKPSCAQNDPSVEDAWDTAVPVCAPAGKLIPQTNEPIRIVETLDPKFAGEPSPGIFVFDAERNLSGWAQISIQAPRGSEIVLRFAENLGSDGMIDRGTLRSAAATDIYIAKGEGIEVWEPRFTYHGFRFVQIEGLPDVPGPQTVRIRVVRSAVTRRGSFKCDHELLNQIQETVVNTEASNLHSVPTDCPQRNERMGWLNDMTVRAEQALYNFRLDRFYGKWLDDIADTQAPDGSITDTAPFKWGKRPADPVSVSFLLTAWLTYRHYGDIRLIERHYQSFKKWTEFLLSESRNGILDRSSWGDWAPPKEFAVPGSDGAGAIADGTPGSLVSTAFFHYHTLLLADIAETLGHSSDRETWHEIARGVHEAFNSKFWDSYNGGYGSNNQACNALALGLALVPEDRVAKTVANLVADVEAHNFHLTTGNLSTKYLLETLTEHGHVDPAFRVATQTTYPSWGFMLANGATTLWERWEHLTGASMNSHNHPMHGSISSWFYKYLAGIRFRFGAGSEPPIEFHPYFPSALGWVHASCPCLHGEVMASWKRCENLIIFDFHIPENATASIHLPSAKGKNRETSIVGPGVHRMVIASINQTEVL